MQQIKSRCCCVNPLHRKVMKGSVLILVPKSSIENVANSRHVEARKAHTLQSTRFFFVCATSHRFCQIHERSDDGRIDTCNPSKFSHWHQTDWHVFADEILLE